MADNLEQTIKDSLLGWLGQIKVWQGTALFAFTVQGSIAGMLYQFTLLKAFGIHFFDWSGWDDFLLAAFHNPLVIVLTILVDLATYFVISLSSRPAEFADWIAGRTSDRLMRWSGGSGAIQRTTHDAIRGTLRLFIAIGLALLLYLIYALLIETTLARHHDHFSFDVVFVIAISLLILLGMYESIRPWVLGGFVIVLTLIIPPMIAQNWAKEILRHSVAAVGKTEDENSDGFVDVVLADNVVLKSVIPISSTSRYAFFLEKAQSESCPASAADPQPTQHPVLKRTYKHAPALRVLVEVLETKKKSCTAQGSVVPISKIARVVPSALSALGEDHPQSSTDADDSEADRSGNELLTVLKSLREIKVNHKIEAPKKITLEFRPDLK